MQEMSELALTIKSASHVLNLLERVCFSAMHTGALGVPPSEGGGILPRSLVWAAGPWGGLHTAPIPRGRLAGLHI